jgi:hypothetical protein
MSVSLEVEHARPIRINTILPKIGKALKEILNLTYEPEVVADSIWKPNQEASSQDSELFTPGVVEGFDVVIKGEGMIVAVFSREEIDYFAVHPRGWRAAALGAAVAVAIAEHSESEVCDTQGTYTLKEYMKPDEFAQSIKVDKAFDNINEAAEYFFYRLPGVAREKSEGLADNGPL